MSDRPPEMDDLEAMDRIDQRCSLDGCWQVPIVVVAIALLLIALHCASEAEDPETQRDPVTLIDWNT